MKRLRMLSCLLLLCGFLLFPPTGSPCGPFFPDAVFVNTDHPGKPLQWYAEGHLGVLLPGFSRADLVIAYRYLAGRPLSPGERTATLAFWRERYQRQWAGDGSAKDPVEEWIAARKQVLGAQAAAPEIESYQPYDTSFGGYENCLADSFHTAVLALDDRVRRFGGDRPSIEEWIKGQDAVFHDCGPEKIVPAALPENSPAWLKADRIYQIAAAHFYSRSFDQAARDFDQIASDAGSPWKNLAPYLAARAMIRKGTLSDPIGEEALRNAEARLEKIVNDPSQAARHDAARRLLGYIALRIQRLERSIELARLLAGPRPDRDFQQDLVDYTWSLDRLADEPPARGPEPGGPTPEYLKKVQEWSQERDRRWAAVQAANEMTDWVLNFQKTSLSRDHAIALWRKRRSLPWLVAALSKTDANDNAASELLKAAQEVAADSPAYPTVTYHRARLLIQAGENENARALLDAFLSSPPPRLSASSRNLFLAQRMRLAASYHDFLVHAPRPVVDTDFDDGFFGLCAAKTCDDLLYGGTSKDKTKLRFDREAALVLNLRLPLELLAHAATGTELPEPLRGEVAVAAWTRAVMLGRHHLAATLVPEVEKAYPVMKELLDSYLAAKPEDKDQAALFAMLHFPGMRPYVNAGAARGTKMEKIDSYRDNWWCADLGADVESVNFAKNETGARGPKPVIPKDAPSPEFLSPELAKTAGAEWQALAKSGGGAGYLARKTLAWAQDRPQDQRLAEALHYAVRSTRYGCDDAGVSSLSHKAFKLLHEKYPNSKWAKQTPYWF